MNSPSANQARLDYLSERSQKHLEEAQTHRKDLLPALEVEGVIPATEGTIHKDRLGIPLNVTVPIWLLLPDPIEDEDKDLLKLQIAEVDASGVVGEFKDIGDIHEYDSTQIGDIELEIPVTDYPVNGKRQLRYAMKKHSSSTYRESDPLDLIFDTIPPWGSQNPPLAEIPVISGNVITDAFFVGSPAGLEVTLKPYDNQRQQDTYALYFTDTPPADGALPVPVESGAVPPDRKLLIPKSTIETLGDGIYYLAYILIDPATHVSRISHLVKITVNLGALPANLKPPVVPLAADGGLIDLDDVRLGVVTQIEYDNHRSDDFAEVTWGNSDPFKVQIGTSGMPHSIRIPYATLRAAYDFSLGSPQTATVSYRILRHDVSYGLESTDVNVDLSTAGPDPDPIQPGPINPELRAPVIKGAVTPEDNKLREEDAGQPVQLTWDLHPDLKDGQRMRFSWGGIVVPDPAAPDTPLEVIIDTAVDPITVNLEWDVVEKAGNSSKTPVHCIFLKETGEDNQQHSISQLVDVDAIIIEPDPAVFERSVSGEGKILGCESLWVDPKNPDGEPAFLVTVHGLSEYLPAGGKINMKWTPLLGRTGENPISGAGLEIALDFTKEQAEEGFQWEIKPYEKHILPIFSTDISQPEGRGRVEYSFELDGKPLKSKPATIRVALGEPTGGSCPLPVKP